MTEIQIKRVLEHAFEFLTDSDTSEIVKAAFGHKSAREHSDGKDILSVFDYAPNDQRYDFIELLTCEVETRLAYDEVTG